MPPNRLWLLNRFMAHQDVSYLLGVVVRTRPTRTLVGRKSGRVFLLLFVLLQVPLSEEEIHVGDENQEV